MSSAQRSIWFAHALNPDGNAYNVSLAWRVQGDIRLDALTDALADVIDRHEVLRTRFVQDSDGNVAQIVSEYIDLAVPVTPIDETSLAAAVADFENAPFDLARGAIRTTLLQLSPTDHVFVLALHHIACDGWSLSLLIDDLSIAYSRRLRSADPDWPDPEIQFADYASWESVMSQARNRSRSGGSPCGTAVTLSYRSIGHGHPSRPRPAPAFPCGSTGP